jgi:hypothetical protein
MEFGAHADSVVGVGIAHVVVTAAIVLPMYLLPLNAPWE